jgi:hypothetical protein
MGGAGSVSPMIRGRGIRQGSSRVAASAVAEDPDPLDST